MVQRIDFLSDEQNAQMDAHADRWIGNGLSTGATDRERFRQVIRRCYGHAGLPWHDKVVWVSSPAVLALAVALAERPRSAATRPAVSDAALAEPVAEALAAALPGSGAPTHRPVREQLECALADPVTEAIMRAADVTVIDAVERCVRGVVIHALREAAGTLVAGAVSETLSCALSPQDAAEFFVRPRYMLGLGYGRWFGPPFTSFFTEAGGLELPPGLARLASDYAQAASGAWWYCPYRDFLFVCERPREIHLEPTQIVDLRGRRLQRLHNLAGPAIAWPDGWGIHAIHGRRVPARIIEHPESLTVRDIEEERNAEVRRVMLERYGLPRYMRDCGAQVVDELPLDHPIVGLRGARLLVKVLPGEPEPLVYLEMRNSSPEPDGSFRRYLERIDPKAYGGDAGRLCHAAMASRWRYRDEHGQLQLTFPGWRQYRPLQES